MLVSASTCLIPARKKASIVTAQEFQIERQKRALAHRRSQIASRIESLRIEFNHFHPSHLRANAESEKLVKMTKNNSFWKFSSLGGIAEFGYTSRGNLDLNKMYELKPLVEIEKPKFIHVLAYEGEKLGDYISRVLQQMLNDKDPDSVERLTTAFERLTPRFWKGVSRLPLAKQEPEIGLKSKNKLRKNHFRYLEIARRYTHQTEKRQVLLIDQTNLSWLVHLDRTRPKENSLTRSLGIVLFEQAYATMPVKSYYRSAKKPRFESLATNLSPAAKNSPEQKL